MAARGRRSEGVSFPVTVRRGTACWRVLPGGVGSLVLSHSGSGCGLCVQTHLFKQVQIQVKTGEGNVTQ